MKKITMTLLALVLVLMMVFGVVACDTTKDPDPKPTDPTAEAPVSNEPGEVTPEPVEELVKGTTPDVPADRYDATVTPRTGNNANMPLVLSTSTLDGKFSPFFATSAYDVDATGQVGLGLLYYDKTGAPSAGIDDPCLAYSYTNEVSEDGATSVYHITLKNGITFSDGVEVTAKDVLFSIYTLCDPLYDGSSTMYSMDIQGMKEYRLQTSKEAIDLADKILAAGIGTAEDGTMTYGEAEGVTPEQQAEFWKYFDECGEAFAQAIVDYVNANYGSDDYVQGYFNPNMTYAEVAASEGLKVAFGMGMWGFGGYGEDGNFADALGTVYDMTTTAPTAADYWTNIVKSYGYDLSDSGINREKADDFNIQDLVYAKYLSIEGAVEGGVNNISGITSGLEKCEDGVVREYIEIVIDGVDPVAIFKIGVTVAPWHYYTEGFTGEMNEHGVSLNDPAFMAHLKTKNDKPMGAGPYVFMEYKDNVITYEANDGFLLGSPKIKTFRYQVITLGQEKDAVLTGTVHYSDPSASAQIINDITAGEGDYAKVAYTLVDNDGYGYIGIQGQAIPEFEVRQAIAHALNVELCIADYYGELASVNYRTMTKILWAYPEDPECLYPYDGTGETSKALFLKAGYTYDEAANIMNYPEGHEKYGTQVTFSFTLPSEAKDHPAGSVFVDAQTVLAKIGVKVDIQVDTNLLNKLNTAYESGIQVWTAAWGSGGVDPDMFQIWYSDGKVNQQPPRAGLQWLYENGSDEEKAMLTELNELIVAGRSTLDVEERKAIYKRALELSTGICVEVPTYQRKNLFIFNKDVINADTLFSGADVTPFQSPMSFIWNVELNG